MNRRDLINAMLTLPVAGALAGCRRKPEPDYSSGGTLRIVLHGPFAVVLNKARQSRIHAFVPFDNDDKERKHEFRFPTQVGVVGEESKHASFHFELPEEGLEGNRRQPYADRGFDDLNFDVGAWEPKPQDYFVALDLPAPDVITFNPRWVENVLFADGKPGTMPLDHILEYRVRDLSKVQIRSRQLGSLRPLSCSDMRQEYDKQRDRGTKDDVSRSPMEHGIVRQELTRCSDSEVSTFFFGVGLPPSQYEGKAATAHALNFFNESLLESFPNAPDLRRKKLHAIGVSGCRPVGDIYTAPTLVPAVQRYPMPGPYLLPVASIEDCRAGGVIGQTR